ncbi:MAG: DUF3817 domain-containing protein [Prosthecobacter sp.]|uniref:DUF3817 domain-containing protein n=1 Tax=Prosthecobacter sp. TaxID=1965333 RepID=UPI0026229305|nr:DUF3817 domain-containing protein [Prosthecobacter sp.]MCF7789690.1 DUF3817 domain-containing protein [Prosthecobacter sp.]
MKHPVSFLRIVGLFEAISYLILLFVAVPLKYFGGQPLAVKIVGPIHGGLFVVFCFALWRVLMSTGWPLSRAALVFIASLLPFVPFFIDRRMRAWVAADSNQTPA